MCWVIGLISSAAFWTAVSAVALISTLIWVKRYTKATTAMADATKAMADAQREMTLLQRRPVVAVGCANEKVFHFTTTFQNFSFAHAKARVVATIKIDGKELALPEGHYDGKKVWQIQAVGPEGPTFCGHLDLPRVLAHNGMSNPAESTVDAHVTLETWVINHNDPEEGLYKDENKNPVLHWDWVHPPGRWVPEIAPMLRRS